MLSRDPAVGEAYAADPLVYHGGWKVRRCRPSSPPTTRSPPAPASARCRCSTCTAATTNSSRPGSPEPVVERLAGQDTELDVIDGARHEVFNETDQAETIGRVADFAERVT